MPNVENKGVTTETPVVKDQIKKKHPTLTPLRTIAALVIATVGLGVQHHFENNVKMSPSGITSDVTGVPETFKEDLTWLLHRIGLEKPPNTKDLISNLLNKDKKELRITSFNIIKNAGNLIDSSPAFNENGEPLLILPNPGDNGSIAVTKKTLAELGVYNPPDPTEESWWRFDNIPANVPQPLPHAGYVFVEHNPPDFYPNPDGTPSITGYVEYWENPDGSLGGLSFDPEDIRFTSLIDLPEASKDNSQYKNGKWLDAGTYIFMPEVTLTVHYSVGANIAPLIVTDPATGQQGIPQR
jgi:hypothetical protein